jgi:hypothetical protein
VSNQLTRSVHRLLFRRLSVAALLLCLLFGSIAYVNDQQRIKDDAAQIAVVRIDQFQLYIRDLLDADEPFSTQQLQSRLGEFRVATGTANIRSGRFVLVQIYDTEGTLLLDSGDNDFPGIDTVRSVIDAAPFKPLGADDIEVVDVRLKGQPYVGIDVPMTNTAGKVRGQILVVFAVSEEAMTDLRSGILTTLLYVIGLIFATLLVLYPIIRNLLNRLSSTAMNLLDSNLQILQALGGAIAKRDSDTDAHNYRVSVYSVSLAEATGLSRQGIRSLIKGALLHDVGKLGIRDNILLKPGKLDDDEFTIMKTHVEHGLEIADRADWLQDAQPVIGAHHEKYGGTGYPLGLHGSDIPLNARIFAICDVFDALTSRRPYKDPMSLDESLKIMESGRGMHFDPELLDAFAKIAAELYATYSGKDDDSARDRLDVITDEYFKASAADLL